MNIDVSNKLEYRWAPPLFRFSRRWRCKRLARLSCCLLQPLAFGRYFLLLHHDDFQIRSILNTTQLILHVDRLEQYPAARTTIFGGSLPVNRLGNGMFVLEICRICLLFYKPGDLDIRQQEIHAASRKVN